MINDGRLRFRKSPRYYTTRPYSFYVCTRCVLPRSCNGDETRGESSRKHRIRIFRKSRNTSYSFVAEKKNRYTADTVLRDNRVHQARCLPNKCNCNNILFKICLKTVFSTLETFERNKFVLVHRARFSIIV